MSTNLDKRHIPWAMAAVRAALGPLLFAGAACSWNGVTLAIIVVTALVSDIYDGVLARRWKCDTAGVRLFDSMADTVFYLFTAVALWVSQPQLCRSYRGLLVALLGLEGARFAFDFVKFGKPASYHSYLAKTWGLMMAVAVVAAFAIHRGSVLVPAALGLGILCDLEGLAMSVVMPVWRKDVKTLAEAWRIRGRFEQWMVRRVRSRRSALGGKQRFVFSGFFALLLSVVLVSPAFAVEAGQVAFTGGSLSVAQGTVGSFDLVSPDAVIFKYGGAGSTQSTKANQVEIVYKNISGVSYATELAHHLGVLPAIAVGLARKRERRHLFTIKYTDASDTVQAVIFEVSKKDAPALLEVLRARAPQASVEVKMT
jgi:phosphatidylglycerophosphate synthase